MSEDNWVEKIGKPALASLREMVAALECDYDRLQELRDERETLADAVKEAKEAEKEARESLSVYGTVAAEDTEGEAEAAQLAKELHEAELNANAAENSLSDWDDENAEELQDLEDAARPCGNECSDQDDARRMIEEDALSVEVRSGWATIGEPMEAEEFAILLSTGGPATRIRGELDSHGEPYRAWLEVQGWGKPWTEYYETGAAEVLLSYARCFCFAR